MISRIRHVHIRDCKGRQTSPGAPEDQANGRGDIDLLAYIRVLHEHGYAGPVDLDRSEVAALLDREVAAYGLVDAVPVQSPGW